MKTFFVTFGDLLIDYHLVVKAANEDIVRAFMRKKSGINCWCRVTEERPDTKPLRPTALELCYSSAEHV